MSVLDDTFNYFKLHPPPPGFMFATLTATEQVVPNLPAGIFTASGVPVTYVSVPPATISFEVTRYCKTPPPSGPPPAPFKVKLTQNVGPVYSMDIAFKKPFSCPHAEVDTASGVVYGSQGAQFVTLVLNPSATQG
jgi:hypothetical protein